MTLISLRLTAGLAAVPFPQQPRRSYNLRLYGGLRAYVFQNAIEDGN